MVNGIFAEQLHMDFSRFSALAYSIDNYNDKLNGNYYELNIYSTSLSEQEGSEAGLLECFFYRFKQDIESDIEQARTRYLTTFDNI